MAEQLGCRIRVPGSGLSQGREFPIMIRHSYLIGQACPGPAGTPRQTNGISGDNRVNSTAFSRFMTAARHETLDYPLPSVIRFALPAPGERRKEQSELFSPVTNVPNASLPGFTLILSR